jgi:hypothetical protein
MLLRALVPFLCAVGMLVMPSRAAAPIDSIAGEFDGKYRSSLRTFVAEEGGALNQNGGIWFGFGQEGTSVEGAMALLVDDEPSGIYDLTGNAGNGVFQVLAFEEVGLIVMHGTMKGAPGKRTMKGKGSIHTEFGVGEIKFSVKEIQLDEVK